MRRKKFAIDVCGQKVSLEIVNNKTAIVDNAAAYTDAVSSISVNVEASESWGRPLPEMLAHELSHLIVSSFYNDSLRQPVSFDALDETIATISGKVIETMMKNEKTINDYMQYIYSIIEKNGGK